jgi:hypothetical protein
MLIRLGSDFVAKGCYSFVLPDTTSRKSELAFEKRILACCEESYTQF